MRTIERCFPKWLIVTILIFCAAFVDARPAFANMPAAFIFVLAPFTFMWATVLGVVFEIFWVKYFFRLNWTPTVLGVIFANVISTFLGVFPIFLISIPVELAIRHLLAQHVISTQLLVGWVIAQFLLPLINAGIELPVLTRFGVPWAWRSAKLVYAANFVTVAILIWPPWLISPN